MKSVNNLSELQEIVSSASGKVVIIDFYADWCGPCKMISPKFENFSNTYTNVVAVKVNVDQAEDIAAKYQIQAMPTFVALKNGEKVGSVVGANDVELENLFKKYN